MIADAEETVKNGRYQDARTKLDDARGRFPALWSRDMDVDRLDKEVRFHLDCEAARQSFGKRDLATALAKIKDAISIRPEDKEAADLRDKIQTAVDKAEVEQHRQKAEIAITAEDLRGAVDEIIQAREILEKPTNATWAAPNRDVLAQLAKTPIDRLRKQATDLSGKRQYQEAEEAVRLGQRLSPKDEQLLDLLTKISTLKSDPKSANISGTWVCHEDGNVVKMILTDSGTDSVAWALSETGSSGREITGAFTRTGAALEGRRPFEMQGVHGQLTVKAKIETPDTIIVQSSAFTPSNSRQAPKATTQNIHGRGRQREKRRHQAKPRSQRLAYLILVPLPITLEHGRIKAILQGRGHRRPR